MSPLPYHLLLAYLSISFYHHTTAEFVQIHQTSVDALNPSSNGASIAHNAHSTTISGSIYNVTVQSQDEYDLRLSLSSQWGFASSESVLIVTIHGNTPDP